MKITDRIPGNQLSYEEGDKIAENVMSRLNPNNLDPIELWKELIALNVGEAIAVVEQCSKDEFYLLYTYYLKKVSHRVFVANKENVIRFINDNFDDEWGEGIDVIIVDLNFEKIIMGNHDGVLVTRLD